MARPLNLLYRVTLIAMTLLGGACGVWDFVAGSSATSPATETPLPGNFVHLSISSTKNSCTCDNSVLVDCSLRFRVQLSLSSKQKSQFEGAKLQGYIAAPGSELYHPVQMTLKGGEGSFEWRSWSKDEIADLLTSGDVRSWSFPVAITHIGNLAVSGPGSRLDLKMDVAVTNPAKPRIRCAQWGDQTGRPYQVVPSQRPASIVATFYASLTTEYEVAFEARENDVLDPDDIIAKGTYSRLSADRTQAIFAVSLRGGYDPVDVNGSDNCLYFGRVWLARDPTHVLPDEIDNYQTINDKLIEHFATLLDYSETPGWTNGCAGE